MYPSQHWPSQEQCSEDDGQIQWTQHAGLDLPPVVDYSADGGQVDEFVKPIPLLAAEFADGPCGGCCREGNEQRVGSKSSDDETALCNVGLEYAHVEVEIEREIGREMNARVEESEEAEKAAELNKPREPRR